MFPRSQRRALAHTHPPGVNWFSSQDMDIVLGRGILGFLVPAMPVYLSVIFKGQLEVRLFADDMCPNRQGGGSMIFSR